MSRPRAPQWRSRVVLCALAIGAVAPAWEAGAAGESAAVTAPRPWQILSLSASDPYLPAFVAIDGAMRAALTDPRQHPVAIYSEALDMLRFPGATIEHDLVSLLTTKYAGRHVDAVVAAAGPALEFAIRHRERLWPGVPIIYHSVPLELIDSMSLPTNVVGLPLRFDVLGTARLALRARPQARRLVVIGGSGALDRQIAGIAQAQLQSLDTNVEVDLWFDRTLQEVVHDVAAIAAADAVLYLSMSRDASDRIMVPRDVMGQLAAASKAPVFSVYETYLGAGLVAGMVDSYAQRGRAVAELTRNVLSNPGVALPAVAAQPLTCVADARQLERFDIPAAILPPGCEVAPLAPSLWRDYRWYVVAALAALAAQSALVVALVLQRRGRRRAEADARSRAGELAQASRLVLAGELSASIAHEINQPLGSILANAGAAEALLRKGDADPGALREIIADIRKADIRAGEIVRHTRALVTAGEGEHMALDVNTIVADVRGFLAGEAKLRNVTIHEQLVTSPPPVMGDRIQLQQALVNLCVNAMDAMDDNRGPKRLFLHTRTPGDASVRILVTDTGPGISPDMLPRLFDAFFTSKARGVGLGLSLTRSIVASHGGTLTARNAEGKGAEFEIVLPTAMARRDANPAGASA